MRTKAEINNSEWFGELPKDWSMVPLSSLFRFSKGLSITKADLVETGKPVISYGQIHSKRNVGVETRKSLLRRVPNDFADKGSASRVLVNGFVFADTSEDLEGCGNNVRNDFLSDLYGGYHTVVLNPKSVFDSKFLAYLFTTNAWRYQIRRDLVDVKLFSVNQTSLNEVYVVVPPEDVQRRIVSYLDKRCAAIDDDVTKRREVIDRLKEYKKSLIAHVVTKGLDPNAEMKDSDIKWVDQIPSNWQTSKLKALFKITKRIAGIEGLTVLSITQDGIKPKDFSTGKGQFAETYSHYQLVDQGDFAMNHMDLLTGWVDISRYEGVTSPDYRVFSVRDLATSNPSYYLYLFQMCYLNRVFFGSANGIADKGRMRLQTSAFNNFVVPVPPLDEQEKIATYLDKRRAAIDEAISRQEQLIEKLDEYRKSIIHHAVTGKIDCTEA